MLEQQGFRVTRGVAGMPTAVMGEAGEGGPVIAILGEYDALPGLSQEAGVAEQRPVVAGGNGHGCGHNLLGAGSLLAATAVKDYLAATASKGRVRYYGCPAEEGGSAKGFMVRAGAVRRRRYRDLLASGGLRRRQQPDLARLQRDRLPLHRPRLPCRGGAASRPQRARCGGADECRRQLHARAHADRRAHPLRDDRCRRRRAERGAGAARRCAISIRARDLPELQRLLARVQKIAEGAALMTETSVRSEIVSGDANLVGNTPLEQRMHRNLERLGPPVFDDAGPRLRGGDPGDADRRGYRNRPSRGSA